MDPLARHKLVNSPGRIFDHSTIHGKVHSCLYRMPWNLILPLSALAFLIFISALSIKSGLEQAELYRIDRTTPSGIILTTMSSSTTTAAPFLNSTEEDTTTMSTLSTLKTDS